MKFNLVLNCRLLLRLFQDYIQMKKKERVQLIYGKQKTIR